MKLATFSTQGRTRVGVVRQDAMADLSALAPELPTEITALLAAGPDALAAARQAAERAKLAFVIGRRCRHVPRARARDVIAGYCTWARSKIT